MTPTRRGFLIGGASLFCAPAIVRASSLMHLTPIPESVYADLKYAVRIGVVTPVPMFSVDHLPTLNSPRMTKSQIETWNRLRAHTGMVMTIEDGTPRSQHYTPYAGYDLIYPKFSDRPT